MSETKFTPGPWFVSTANDENAYEMGVQSEHDVKWHVCDICGGRDIDQQANAHLIAAAPELFEALNLMVTTHDEGGWPTATIMIARAALAKSRGEK